MAFDEYFGPDITAVDLQASDRWEAIDELVDHLVASKKIHHQDRDSIVESVRQREMAASTGIGFGIAIPHAATPVVTEVVAAVGRSRSGIQFDALDQKPVDLVCLFLVPAGQLQKHVDTLANIVKLLHRRGFRDGLSGR